MALVFESLLSRNSPNQQLARFECTVHEIVEFCGYRIQHWEILHFAIPLYHFIIFEYHDLLMLQAPRHFEFRSSPYFHPFFMILFHSSPRY